VPAPGLSTLLLAGIVAIASALAVLKAEPLAEGIAGWWREVTGRDTSLASPLDLGWLGFSYVAFRLIHTLRDRQTGVLPDLRLREFVAYTVFFPSFTAGPIDRAEHFAGELRALPAMRAFDSDRYLLGLTRIGSGLLKKFVIADSLAAGLALTPAAAAEADSALGLWVLLYGYAFRLYLDFSGYTDIAIGVALLFGVRLPENFVRPYTRSNITVFWQSWHMTLSAWARAYVFSPLSRWMLKLEHRPAPWAMVLIAQAATMLTIGLWHGVTWNFAIWGLWHAAGLFLHKQWSDRTRATHRRMAPFPRRKAAWTLVGWAITFHFVVLGWVWFLVPEPREALAVLGGLFGVGL
jgi:alginate O-acetyltransferase complex protein AlgI